MSTIGEFCNRTVVIATRRDSVLEAAKRMRDYHVGSVVVIEDRDGVRVPVGMITDRDIVVNLVAQGFTDIASHRVGDVMSAGVLTAREDERFEDAVERMRSFGVRRLPVVNAKGGLEGLVTFDDLLGFIGEELGSLTTLLERESKREQRKWPTEPATSTHH